MFQINGGEGGIRTPGRVTPTTDFESVPFDHSGTSPSEKLGSKGLSQSLQGLNGDLLMLYASKSNRLQLEGEGDLLTDSGVDGLPGYFAGFHFELEMESIAGC